MAGYNPQAAAMGLDTAETNPVLLKKMAERKKRMHSKRISEARRRGRVGGQGFENFGKTGKRSSTAPQPRRPSSEKLPDIGAPRQPLEDESNTHYDDASGGEEHEQSHHSARDFASTSPTAFGAAAHRQESHMSRQERAMAMHASKRERMALAEEKRRRRQLGEDDAIEDDFVPFSAQGRRQQQQRARDVASVARHVNSTGPPSARALASTGGGSSYEQMEAERTIAELRQQLADAPGRAAAAAKAEMLSAKRAAKTARNKCAELENRVAELETMLAKEREEKTKLARRLAAERKKQPPVEAGGKGQGGRSKDPDNEADFDERAARVLANAKEAAAMTADTATRARATIAAAATSVSPSPVVRRTVATPDQEPADAEPQLNARADDHELLVDVDVDGDQKEQTATEVPATTPPGSPQSQPAVNSAEPVRVSSVSVCAQPPPARRGRAAAEPGGRRARRQEQTPHKVASPVKSREDPTESQAPEESQVAEEPQPPQTTEDSETLEVQPQLESELTGEWALPNEEPLSIATALVSASDGSAERDENDDAMALLRQRHASDSAARSKSEDDSDPPQAGAEETSNAMLWGERGSDLAPRPLLSGGLDASLMSEGIFDNDPETSAGPGFSPASRLVDGAVEDALSEATNTGSSWAERSAPSSPISPSASQRVNSDVSASAPKSPGSSCIDQQQEELDDLVRELMEEQPHLTREECESAVMDAMGGRKLVPNGGHDLTEVDEQEDQEMAEDAGVPDEDMAAEEEATNSSHEDAQQEQGGLSENTYSDDDEQFESMDAESNENQQQQDSSSTIAAVAGAEPAESQPPSKSGAAGAITVC